MRTIEKVWFQQHSAKYFLLPLLLPFTVLFWLLSTVRKRLYDLNIKSRQQLSCPVVVVGNIGVGGNGKTPVVIHLVEQFKAQGLKVGVISRGYGGRAETYPYLLTETSTAGLSGDEPLLIYRRCNVPVAVGPDRVAAAGCLIELGCELIISDDGLQHYTLARDYEICVIDSKRLFGNGLLLPSGPLREGKWRLNTVDHVVFNGIIEDGSLLKRLDLKTVHQTMSLRGSQVCNLLTGEYLRLTDFVKRQHVVNAMAGIGDPCRFFDYLQSLGFSLKQQQGFDDHQAYNTQQLSSFSKEIPLLMTEKDAVKCHDFAEKNWWYLPVDAEFIENEKNSLVTDIMKTLNR